jgi:hypothetical protein
MMRLPPFCLLLSLWQPFATAQSAPPTSATAPPTQVVYVIGSSTITTYNIDPQTLDASQAGAPLTVNATNLENSLQSVTPSPNDHVLYVIGSPQQLLVYATDSAGTPQGPSLQTLHTSGLLQVVLNPQGSLLYSLSETASVKYHFFILRRYQVDGEGKLHDGTAVASYRLPAGATTDCGLQLLGFNPEGTELYDEVGCSEPDSMSATYNQRAVGPASGELGPDVEVYRWSNGAFGYEIVQFVNHHIFTFDVPNNFQTGINSVNVYPLVPASATPLFTCTAAMMEACGYAIGVAHPSGKYLFMSTAEDFTEIERVELGAGKIAGTGNYVPYTFEPPLFGQFSPDGSLVYATNSLTSGYWIEIYGFNVASSEVTPGGGILVPNFGIFVAAERD